MKKFILHILLCFVCTSFPFGISCDATDADIYKYTYGEKQGENNFYYCMLDESGNVAELTLQTVTNGSRRWKSDNDYPFIKSDCMQPGERNAVCLKFVAPKSGMLRLADTVSLMIRNDDGTAKGKIESSVLNGNTKIWDRTLLGSDWQQRYDLLTWINEGESLYFCVDCCGSPSNDLTVWFPTVEYVSQTQFKSNIGSTVRGVDNFYFCSFGNTMTLDLPYDAPEQRWKLKGLKYPMVKWDFMIPGSDEPVGMRFVSPQRGMVKLTGAAELKNSNGNVEVMIVKGERELWSAKLNKNNLSALYDISGVPLEKGEQIYFKVDASGSNANDFLYWEPTVDYVEGEYVPESDICTYYQKDTSGVLTQLSEYSGAYTAADGIAYIRGDSVSPTAEYSLVKRFTSEREGRYRVYAHIRPEESDADILTSVYKNGEKVWNQMFPGGEMGTLDVRMMTAKGDTIDVEIRTATDKAVAAEWDCSISEFMGTLFCEASSSAGMTYTITSGQTALLGDMLMNPSVSKVYSMKYGQAHAMQLDVQAMVWKNTVNDEIGSVSKTEIYPGTTSDTVAEITVQKDGMLRIDGNMSVFDVSDGVVSKVYLNDKLLWSSRVGGERAVRWDEPFDVCYFNNAVHLVSNVKRNDVLKMTFNRWRKSVRDRVDISDIKLSYVTGDILSETTCYKLKNSVTADAKNKKLTVNGIALDADIISKDDGVYIKISDIENIFSTDYDLSDIITESGVQYVRFGAAVESVGKVSERVNEKFEIAYDGIPVLFGYAECSEIDTALENNSFYAAIAR